MARQSAYGIRLPDRYDHLILCEDPTPGGGGSARPTGRVQSGLMGHRFLTNITTAQSPYVVASAGEVVAADTDSGTPGDIIVQLPDSLPANSIVTVKKADQNVNRNTVEVQPTGGARVIESPYFAVDRSSIGIVTPESVSTWIADVDRWRLISAARSSYQEYYRLASPYEVLPGGGTVPIELDTALTPDSLLFSSISGGVLTAIGDDLFLIVEIDAVLEFTIAGNNQAVEMSVVQTTNATTSRTPPIAAGIGHSRGATFLDSRNTRGLLAMDLGQTFQLTATEHYADGSSHVDIVELFMTVKTLS